jgi:hypothetical protein
MEEISVGHVFFALHADSSSWAIANHGASAVKQVVHLERAGADASRPHPLYRVCWVAIQQERRGRGPSRACRAGGSGLRTGFACLAHSRTNRPSPNPSPPKLRCSRSSTLLSEVPV